MAKEKKLKEVNKKDYFKELAAFFLIILMIILLGNLGTLGFYGSLIIKILLGDWSFLVLSYILISLIHFLIKGKGLNTHSLSFQGLVFIYLAITLLCHMTIYNSLALTSKNVFSKTLELYKNYFKDFDSSYYVGGGIIGLLLFQICILLLGKTGVIIVGLALIIMGLSYLMNKSVIDFLKRFKTLYLLLNKIRTKIISYFKKLSLARNDEKPDFRKKRPTISYLNDIKESTNKILEEELVKENTFKIKSIISKNNLPIELITYHIGFSFTSYIFKLKTSFISSSYNEIFKIFDTECFYMLENNILTIEVINKFKELLTLKKVLVEFEEIPLGLNSNLDLYSFNFNEVKPYILAGSGYSGIKSFIRCFITSLIIINKEDFLINMLDFKKDFKELRGLNPSLNYRDTIDSINKTVEDLVYEYDKRYEILKYLECNDYLDANKKIKENYTKIELICPNFIILNTSLKHLSNDIQEKLNYLITVGRKVGFYFMIIIRTSDELFGLNLSIFKILTFKINDISLSLKLLNNELACHLDGKGEFLLLDNKKISHLQAPYCSTTDYLKILEKFIS